MKKKVIEISVGLFIILGIIAFFVLAFCTSGLIEYTTHPTYTVTADFNNIGDLKVRAPVSIAGVRIGQVQGIHLDNKSFHAVVTLALDGKENQIPEDSEASILTAGLLGSNYIDIAPGFESDYLVNDSQIQTTHSAIILENMIGQFLFKTQKDSSSAQQKHK